MRAHTTLLLLLLAAIDDASGLRLNVGRRAVSLAGLAGLAPLPALAAEPSIFVGRYTDPNHPGGFREISLLETKLGPFQLAKVVGGGGRGEPASFELPAMVNLNDQSIIIDFSPKGGPKDFRGVWQDDGIRFVLDGNKWPKQAPKVE